ncbi:MAG: hypothetical protein B1H03_02175 [Planctomycetales bacterium 4484_113]|nr:MAG: hypothetical protein B1H03_02175 [Planctomycetales bacterium 4484_113]
MYRLLDAGLVAFVLAGLAWSADLISIPAALFGFVVAFIILLGAGVPGIIILALFFPISTHLSHQIRLWREKAQIREAEATGAQPPLVVEEELPQKRPRLSPDWKQMAANGAVGCAFALAYYLFDVQFWHPGLTAASCPLALWRNLATSFPASSALIAGLVASLASAAADTASHEVGVTTRGGTYLLIRRQRVLAGTTGGVSVLGTSVMLLTVLLFVLAAWLMHMGTSWGFLVAIAAGAIIGNAFDSVLGELAEQRYKAWGNNLTNLASTAVAGLAACGLAAWLG